MNASPDAGAPLERVRQVLSERWPEACATTDTSRCGGYRTGIAPLDQLFAKGGIPAGQWIEITGAPGSGRTSLLFAVMAGLTPRGTCAYLDFAKMFFPPAAAAAGVDLRAMRVARPDNLCEGIRIAEQLLDLRAATYLVFDLAGTTDRMPQIVAHRLRRSTLRAGGLIFLVTDERSAAIGQSMVSLRLEVTRASPARLAIRVVRSRICREGSRFEYTPKDCLPGGGG